MRPVALLLLVASAPLAASLPGDGCSALPLFSSETLGPRCVVVESGGSVTFSFPGLVPHWPGEVPTIDQRREGSCFDFFVERGRMQRAGDAYTVAFQLDEDGLAASTDGGATWRACASAGSGAVVAFCHLHARSIGRILVRPHA